MTTLKKYKLHFDEIQQQLDTYRQQDYNFSDGRILGSMCTQPHLIAKEAYMKFLETNLGDPALFPGTKQIESQLIHFIMQLVQAPATAGGQIVSGGTEGNITAIWLAKQLTGKKEVIIPENAHFSFKKIASLMDIKLILMPLTSQYVLDMTSFQDKISNDTAAVVGVAGSTELGTIDPIPEVSKICSDNNIFLHIDAAFGGFVIPFLKQLDYEVPDFDFSLKGVSSLSIDSHKMGYSAIPLGTLLIREKEWLDQVSVHSPCISSDTQAGILGTRSGGPVAAAYAVTKLLGMDGYRQVVEQCMNTTLYAENQLTELGLSLMIKPQMNVLGVKLNHVSAVVQKLAEQGWRVNKIDHLSCIRIVVMPHVTNSVIDAFIPVLKQVCEEVGEL